MKTASFFGQILLLLALAGCSPSNRSEEGLLKNVFHAIKEKDWDSYQKLTITYADFIQKAQGTGKFEEKLGYAGGVMKPEEEQGQRKQFDRAVIAGTGMIDFQRAQFVSVGSVILENKMEVLGGEQAVSYKIFSLKLRIDWAETDSKDLHPRFTVVPWENEYRLLRLELPLTTTEQ